MLEDAKQMLGRSSIVLTSNARGLAGTEVDQSGPP
jgi:hypothetical protein